MNPALAAAAAQQHSRPAHERFAGVGQVRELRQAAAAGTAAFGTSARARVAGGRPQSFEHGPGSGPRQIFVDRVLSLARQPAIDELVRPGVAKAVAYGGRQLASPTNGVSALASQLAPLVGSRSAAMPTKPQWIGIPMW